MCGLGTHVVTCVQTAIKDHLTVLISGHVVEACLALQDLNFAVYNRKFGLKVNKCENQTSHDSTINPQHLTLAAIGAETKDADLCIIFHCLTCTQKNYSAML